MKKFFALGGAVASIVVIVLGILLFLGTFNENASLASASLSDYGISRDHDSGWAKFGSDFYTYINNNAAEVAQSNIAIVENQKDISYQLKTVSSNQRVTNSNISKVCGIFLVCVGLVSFFAFGMCIPSSTNDNGNTVGVFDDKLLVSFNKSTKTTAEQNFNHEDKEAEDKEAETTETSSEAHDSQATEEKIKEEVPVEVSNGAPVAEQRTYIKNRIAALRVERNMIPFDDQEARATVKKEIDELIQKLNELPQE